MTINTDSRESREKGWIWRSRIVSQEVKDVKKKQKQIKKGSAERREKEGLDGNQEAEGGWSGHKDKGSGGRNRQKEGEQTQRSERNKAQTQWQEGQT